MNIFARMTVKMRLLTGFGTLLLMLILTTVGTKEVNFIDNTLSNITDVNSVKQRYAINFRGSVHDRAIAIRDIAITDNLNSITAFENEIRTLEDFYKTSETQMKTMRDTGITFSTTEVDILKQIEAIRAHTLPLINDIITAKRNGENVNLRVLQEARPAFIEWLNIINTFIDYQEQQNQIATPKA